jgi:hypothetical protein
MMTMRTRTHRLRFNHSPERKHTGSEGRTKEVQDVEHLLRGPSVLGWWGLASYTSIACRRDDALFAFDLVMGAVCCRVEFEKMGVKRIT